MNDASNVSKTAAYVALYRALETRELGRPALFHDPYAIRFLPWSQRALLYAARTPRLQRYLARYADSRAPGARTSAIARTAFIDDVVRRARADGVEQLVLLGAGFDCRAARLPELAEARVFEVDRAATQAHKRAVLEPGRSHYVPVDFQHDDVFEQLTQHGWQRQTVSLFVWEGVTNYLDERSVRRVLEGVSRCARGSTIVFTYVHRGVIDHSVTFEGAERIVQNVKGMREPWTFGIAPEELSSFLASTGLRLREDLGADDYRARYLPASESQRGYRFYRIAVAEAR